MASLRMFYVIFVVLATVILESSTTIVGDKIDIGVCYGMLGNNLPNAANVINLYKQYGIAKMRLFEPNHAALTALRGSGIKVTLGVRNEDTPNIAASVDGAMSWFVENVQPYLSDVNFQYISVANEQIPGDYASYIAPAMRNIQAVLDNHNLNSIKVTTTVATAGLANSYPPSATTFSPDTKGAFFDVLTFLLQKGSPLMVNVYPYFAYAAEPANVRLSYAQFSSEEAVVKDGDLSYNNLFDATIDAFYWAMEKLGFNNVGVVVSESGWPSAGNGESTTPELALTYNKNYIKHILEGAGTPKRPGIAIEGFIFAMFNENQKPEGVEQNWGLFYPDGRPVYPLF
ncbi:OLC1v1037419C1 [Oldenlandia corymbosa var. corymbosa]|uniref:OLC1v1037419C1 n=1 Tax=Oldenlandia corymbosa var. corymbosa TaxID=529605 RepID=A0AAV1D091_OLDCO|nr:OLC1v1037419C1 [Oldenlandia corymbosa var. corymbosa]